jgi:2-polyprenyl-3-methyl-5-hydroxy-6-metoxy-1,4-benzoquinol methylase
VALVAPSESRATLQPAVERLIAVGYGLTYDAIVRGFPPYEALLDEVAALVARAAGPGPPAATRVLDVSCGVGTVAARLARRGWSVVGLDAVAHLVRVARRHHRDSGLSLSFHHADLAREAPPAGGPFDVLVSMHTLYWHPDPAALLAACRRALKPGGHAVFLTYTRPARVLRVFAELRRRRGWGAAIGALRWLLPTALFDACRSVDPRYLTRHEFETALREAGFEVLEVRQTFLAGISLLAWTRAAGGVAPVAAG